MFKKPEDVIGGYITGVRRKYVNPISFFELALTLAGLILFLIKKFYMDYAIIAPNIFTNSSQSQETFSKVTKPIMEITVEYSSVIFSFFIPLAALISLIVFYNKKHNFTEHIVVYLYSLSLYSLVSSVLGILVLFFIPEHYRTFGLLMVAFVLIYNGYALKRLFQLSFIQFALKTLFFILLAFILYIGISILIGILLFAIGVINPEDFAPKQQ